MQTISVDEVKTKMQENNELQLLDVREQSEREAFNIGGRHLPLGNIVQFDIDTINDWKDKEVIVYCRSGNRSMQACMFLEQQGFSNVKNLTGGMMKWQEQFG